MISYVFQWIRCSYRNLRKTSSSSGGRRCARRVREGFITAHKVISEYEHSYKQFVDDDTPRLFLNFLADAEASYLLLSNHVSIATHSVNFWRNYMGRYGAELRREEFMPLFDGLMVL